MASKINRYNPLRLLNSVPFGIMLMVLIAGYMAIGSGRPFLRSTGVDQWSLFRDWFDKTDLEFFNAWPLKTLMFLLVANLVTVTWRRIPLTPPRYGVWCIHAGIITLILGAGIYYNRKLEGKVRIYANPAAGPNTVEGYYDNDERSLYVRTGKDVPAAYPLANLPRFQQYDDRDGTAAALTRRTGLHDMHPTLSAVNAEGKTVKESLTELVGVKGDLRVDVVGYYPYAVVTTDFDQIDPESKVTGVELTMGQPGDPRNAMDWYAVASDPRYATDTDHMVDIRHVEGDQTVAAKVAEAADQIYHLDVTTPGAKQPASMYVKIGQTVPVGQTGYTLHVLRYNPAWLMFGTGEPAQTLEMMVTAPGQTFRRMVIAGKPTQTDFKLGDPKAGPMGKRQKAPLDAGLTIAFRVEDPYKLLPSENTVKHTLLTPTGSKELVDVEAGFDTPAVVRHFADGSGDVALPAPPSEMGGTPGEAGEPEHPALKLHIERRDHLKPIDHVRPVPANRRDENADANGNFQVVKLRVTVGEWSHEVVVPYAESAGEKLRPDGWRGGFVMLPGAVGPLQFQLGNTRRQLPVRLTLDSFKVVPYPGGGDNLQSAAMDYRSTVTVSGIDDGDTSTEVASLNHPIYVKNGRWLLFQASYDPSTPHAWTMLGVGNRPAVGIMSVGCIMIVAGLLYAFYAKPVIIRRMKERAIAAAANRPPRPAPPASAVPWVESPTGELIRS